MGVIGYIIGRAIRSFFLVLGVAALTFLLTHVVAPNPAYIWAGPHASKSVVQAVIQEYKLNQPYYVQLFYYILSTLSFNYGVSPYFKEPVSTLIATYLPRTLEIVVFAMVITAFLGIYGGAFAAAHKDRAPDYAVRVFYLVSWSMPPFLVALLLQLFLAYELKLLPPNLLADPALTPPKEITGFLLVDALIEHDYAFFYSALRHLVLPTLSLALISFGIITRIMRSSMLQSMRGDFYRTAIMKGIGRRRAIYVHALKNSLIPVITLLALTFSFMIAGSVVIEEVFSYQGIGYLVTQALYNYDYPTLVGSTVVIAIFVILANFVADVMYALVDPRIRLGGGETE